MVMKWLYTVSTIDLFLLGILLPQTPARIVQLGGNGFVIGVLSSICCFLQFILNPIIGTLSDTKGRKPLLKLVLYGLLASNAFIFVEYLWIFLVSRVLNAFFAQTQILIKALVSDHVRKDEQMKVFGNMGAVGSIGFIIGPIVGGYLCQQPNGFYYITALLSAIVAISIYAVEQLPNKSETKKVEKKVNLSAEALQAFKRITKIDFNIFWDLFALRLLAESIYSIFFTTFGPVFMGVFKTEPLTLGYVIAFMSVSMIFANLTLPTIKSTFLGSDVRRCTVIGLYGLAASFALLYMVDTFAAFVLFMVPLAMFRTLLDNVWLETLLTRTTDETKGTVLGGFESTVQMAGMVWPILNALLVESYGYHLSILLSSLLSLFGVFIVRFMNDSKKND